MEQLLAGKHSFAHQAIMSFLRANAFVSLAHSTSSTALYSYCMMSWKDFQLVDKLNLRKTEGYLTPANNDVDG